MGDSRTGSNGQSLLLNAGGGTDTNNSPSLTGNTDSPDTEDNTNDNPDTNPGPDTDPDPEELEDKDGDGVPATLDCDDLDATRFPGNTDAQGHPDVLNDHDIDCAIDTITCSQGSNIPMCGSGNDLGFDIGSEENGMCFSMDVHSGPGLDPFIGASYSLTIRRVRKLESWTSYLGYEWTPENVTACGHNSVGSVADLDASIEYQGNFGNNATYCEPPPPLGIAFELDDIIEVSTAANGYLHSLHIKMTEFLYNPANGTYWEAFVFDDICQFGD